MSISQSIASFVILSVVSASLYGWVWFARDRSIGKVPVPYEPRRAVPWGLLDIILIILGIVLVQIVVAGIAGAVFGPELSDASPILWMAISQAALLIAWVGIMALMCFRSSAPRIDLGLTLRKSDFKVGAFAFAMMAPPMFALQALLSQFTDKQHPLIETLIEDSTLQFFIVGGFAAVVVAPVVEEFIFRVFLQGWLENLAAYFSARRSGVQFREGFGVDLFWGLGLSHKSAPPTAVEDVATSSETGFVTDADALDSMSPASDSANPYAAPPNFADDSAQDGIERTHDEPTEEHLPMRPSFWPVLVSSVIFAAAHIGNGPDPIPLFFLAVGLGLLYQRTHRVWPCITVHCLLNGISLFNLWVIVNSPELAEQLLK